MRLTQASDFSRELIFALILCPKSLTLDSSSFDKLERNLFFQTVRLLEKTEIVSSILVLINQGVVSPLVKGKKKPLKIFLVPKNTWNWGEFKTFNSHSRFKLREIRNLAKLVDSYVRNDGSIQFSYSGLRLFARGDLIFA